MDLQNRVEFALWLRKLEYRLLKAFGFVDEKGFVTRALLPKWIEDKFILQPLKELRDYSQERFR